MTERRPNDPLQHVPKQQNQQTQQKHEDGNTVDAMHHTQVEIGPLSVVLFLFERGRRIRVRVFEQRKRIEVV